MEPPADSRRLAVPLLARALGALGIYAALAVLALAGTLVSPKFASADNLLNVLRNVTLLGIVCTGVAFITYSGHYVDLSIPSIMAFSGLAAISMQRYGVVASLLGGLAAGLLVGVVNGAVVGYGRVNPIIWTLAMAFMLDGFLRWFYGGRQIYPDAGTPAGSAFLGLSQAELAGLPLPTLVMLALAALGHGVMRYSRFGAQVRLVGAAYEVARLSGVDARRIVLQVFAVSAAATTVAGLLLTSMNKQGTFETGLGYDFNAVTAVVLGGVSLSGGRGSIAGVIGGVLVIGVLLNLMTLAGVSSFGQMVVKGCVFVSVVAATSLFARRTGRVDA